MVMQAPGAAVEPHQSQVPPPPPAAALDASQQPIGAQRQPANEPGHASQASVAASAADSSQATLPYPTPHLTSSMAAGAAAASQASFAAGNTPCNGLDLRVGLHNGVRALAEAAGVAASERGMRQRGLGSAQALPRPPLHQLLPGQHPAAPAERPAPTVKLERDGRAEGARIRCEGTADPDPDPDHRSSAARAAAALDPDAAAPSAQDPDLRSKRPRLPHPGDSTECAVAAAGYAGAAAAAREPSPAPASDPDRNPLRLVGAAGAAAVMAAVRQQLLAAGWPGKGIKAAMSASLSELGALGLTVDKWRARTEALLAEKVAGP